LWLLFVLFPVFERGKLMSLLRKCVFTLVAVAAIHAGSTARAVSVTYFGSATPNFTAPPSWSVGDPLSTSQLWDVFTGNNGAANLAAPGNFLSNGGLATPTLNVAGGFSPAIYNFSQGAVTATVPNFGGPTGSLTGGTRVVVQAALTVGPNATLDALAYSILPGTLSVTDTLGNSLLGGSPGDAAITLLSSYTGTFTFGGLIVPGEQWKYEFYLPNWTGDVKVSWTENQHSVVDAVRVDTRIVPEPATWVLGGLAAIGGCLLARRARRNAA
jgi:hypothetical protein